MNFVSGPSNNDHSIVLPLLKMRVVLKTQFVVNRTQSDRDQYDHDRDYEILLDFVEFHWLMMK